ncbi:hypothetical protein FNV43_RR06501 [Rhamnella rubrinervis]|uniref:Uncharacterized protein n=1 Tax=Rhamnella rubrinervis TaxID=2594499 RepID=A0A8K0HEN8_9ROSA|nr:hypothetical protein FNV43_RR06501 [Rhamnella rubrinervis]
MPTVAILGTHCRSEKCGLQIDMARVIIFLYETAKREALEGAISEQQAEQSFEEEDLSNQQAEEIPEGIPLPILEVPYLHVLEGCIRLLYDVPTDPLWASYPAADMGKLKMKISKAKLEATKKKKRDKQATAKGGASSATDKGEERPSSTVVVESSSSNRHSFWRVSSL